MTTEINVNAASGGGISLKDFTDYQHVWRHNGVTVDGDGAMSISDAIAVPNAPLMLPKVITNIVKEAIEPVLVGTMLLQRINYSYGQTITFPAVGALVAADIPETGEYPERQLQMGGSTVTATIGKSGVAVKITEEMIRYSQFDVVGLHLRAAGRALARHKEQKIFNYIRAMGTKIFDNVTPTASLKGVCTGRDLQGTPNGSLTMDDLFDAYAHVLMQGFTPDTLLMHPLMWSMFVKDPTLRAFAMQSGGGTHFAGWQGDPRSRFAPWEASSQGGLGVGTGTNLVQGPSTASTGAGAGGTAASPLATFSQTLTSAPQIPSYFPFPLRIIVSPLVPFDPAKKVSDIYIFDSNELGVLIVDEDVTTEEFDDPARDIRKIKLRERYAIGILNEGQGIGVMKNVHVVPNEVVLPAQAHVDVASSVLAPVSPTASVL